MRFGKERRKTSHALQHFLTLAIFAGVMLLFLWCVSILSTTNAQEQKQSLENAIDRCISQCYALEGTYPPNLAYMEEHYGLTYDKNSFFVDYQAIGSNLPPDVTVIAKDGE